MSAAVGQAPARPAAPNARMRIPISELVVGLGLVGILLLMLVPVHPVLLDMFLTLDLTLAVLVLMIAVYVSKPLDFEGFPTVLLFTTLFRLSLNVATTRLILTGGDRGAAAVGRVVTAFGEFVAGGDPVVGGVVFLILVVINFVVITKGAGRIAEVSARFTLDALPGKQLSIDANLNSGLIGEQEARERRRALEREAEFYGSMDGAGKFVRGDAIAGVIITIINIIGGLLIGVVRRDMSFGEAGRLYTVLTIGDGLAAQIPALLISTAAGLVVTKVSDGESLGTTLQGPVRKFPRAALFTSGILGAMSLLPGLPFLPFALIAAGAGLVGRYAGRPQEPTAEGAAAPLAPAEKDIESLLGVDPIAIEVGYALVPLADRKREGNLTVRVKALRRQLAEELGLVVPPVHIRDNLNLKPEGYRILLKGAEVASGELRADGFLALRPGGDLPAIEGRATTDPAFGIPALWIGKAKKAEAERAGCTVVDPASALTTHASVILRRHGHEILGLTQVIAALERVAAEHPRLVEDLIPDPLPRPVLLRVLKNLLREGVSIRDLATILEALAEFAPATKDPSVLTERVRAALARTILQPHLGEGRALAVLTLERDLERRMLDAAAHGTTATALDPVTLRRVLERTREGMATAAPSGEPPVLLVPGALRRPLREALEPFLPDVTILGQGELVSGIQVRSVGTVG
ncbi:MAG: flagellar biosynthesis protein FlhA [Deltaproteobacteria bacterium]|nr:flagellar biosynthesis protein FlhA [Deltaproteobacteria bacterium]